MTHYPIYVEGKWFEGGKKIKIINPATDEAFAEVSTISREGVRSALETAGRTLAHWRSLPGIARSNYLLAISDALHKRSDAIARTITMENGKPLAQSRNEVAKTIDCFRWFAEEARRGYGRVVPNQDQGKRNIVIRQAVGVVGAIAPWNFPLNLASRKIAPALAAGCPVLLKPSSQTPLSAVEFARCAEEAKLPAGVFQLLVGSASEIGDELLANPICRKISFTGSTQVGKTLISGASKTCTKLSLELGGNSPVIIFSDADFDSAVEGAMIAKFRNSGQSCVSANRIFVERPIFERFARAFTGKTKKLKIGDGMDEGVDIGPIINMEGLEFALALIDDAVSKGARLLCGGARWGDKGSFLEPSVLSDVPLDTRCYREEIFAPVAALYPFDTEDEVIERANDTEYGLAAYLFTGNLNRAIRVSEALEAGSIGLNDPVPATSHCPFGGFKQSGWGRELGTEGLDAYLETKHISIGGV